MPVINSYSGGESIIGGAATTSPGANASICALTIVQPGIYQIGLNWMLSGTTETALSNALFRYTRDGVNVDMPLPSISAANFDIIIPRIRVTQISQISFRTVNAATVGAIYGAFITATKVG